MSYDLDVYGKVALSTRDLVKVVSADRALKAQVDKEADAVDAVVWKKTGAHFFTIDGPMGVEPEDLPEGWADGAGATVLYSLSITYDVSAGPEGFSATVDGGAVDAAMAFAERLAARIEGAVIDPQTWEGVEVEPEPVVEAEPDVPKKLYLHFQWFRLLDDTKDLAEIYLRTAREFFPAGVPSRFGTYEPMQGKFPRDDDAKFDAMYREECDDTIGLGMYGVPIAHGKIGGWLNELHKRVQRVQLTFELARLEKLKVVDVIEPFLVALAERAGCFFAFVEITTHPYWTAQPYMEIGLIDPWSGLPVDPQWLTWFSPDYAELVAPHLDESRLTRTPLGTLHRWSDFPAARDELLEVSGDPWIPAEFRGVLSEKNSVHTRCSEAAAIMPESLRYPAPDTPIAKRIAAHYAKVAAYEPVYVVDK